MHHLDNSRFCNLDYHAAGLRKLVARLFEGEPLCPADTLTNLSI